MGDVVELKHLSARKHMVDATKHNKEFSAKVAAMNFSEAESAYEATKGTLCDMVTKMQEAEALLNEFIKNTCNEQDSHAVICAAINYIVALCDSVLKDIPEYADRLDALYQYVLQCETDHMIEKALGKGE